MPIDEALSYSVNVLNAISVPVGLTEQISEPIKKVIGNLNMCIDAIQKNRQQKEAVQEEIPEGGVEVEEIGGEEKTE